ncbi:hypothetical protein AWJ15_01290 [Lacticaseibacillus rhamnosus]|uniref:Lipoprotein n=1 Tax=Lacticaseibacillus chiayiensis TaxID=2100821 RepID=A0A4Q1U0K1_9LACO|nr:MULTISPECIES: hypothetical protein [Lacticaseibacillus]AQG71684.1 hypothetical protein AWJ15_01290 [Lacticaseibacillus rhamnosus]OHY43709.1 hypothetical protein BBX46_14845 [Lacticaseibacillus paracasei]RXT25059.1 hypothetical protein BVJ53_06615 [Lacticaseibacillus chiayiensis]WCZ16771.1 hypothetical protein HKJ34_10560 [Lacticaseibacillus paracasei]
MKTTKLVVGILQIVLSLFILLQSCAVGVGNAIDKSKDVGGSAGFVVAILFIASGIIYIVTRKSEKLGGDIAGLVLMIISWLFAISNAHVYSDLQIWGWVSFIIGVGFFVWHFIALRKQANK